MKIFNFKQLSQLTCYDGEINDLLYAMSTYMYKGYG